MLAVESASRPVMDHTRLLKIQVRVDFEGPVGSSARLTQTPYGVPRGPNRTLPTSRIACEKPLQHGPRAPAAPRWALAT